MEATSAGRKLTFLASVPIAKANGRPTLLMLALEDAKTRDSNEVNATAADDLKHALQNASPEKLMEAFAYATAQVQKRFGGGV